MAHSRESLIFQLQRIFSPANRLMSARHETPLLVEMKVEKLKILIEKNIKFVSFV